MKQLLSFKWVITTIIVILAVGVMIRLGVWQLERLKWRQSFNDHYITQIKATELNLNQIQEYQDLTLMEYRKIVVEGEYDYDHEVYLQNQVYENLPGYHVLTPLKLNDGSAAVIVNRGWIPLDFSEEAFNQIQPKGSVSVSGLIRVALEETDFKNGLGIKEADGTIQYWKYINLEHLSKQIPYDMLPVYIEKDVKPNSQYPVTAFVEIEITQGPHLGYAIQWFFFAALLGGGYPAFVRKTLGETNTGKEKRKVVNENQKK